MSSLGGCADKPALIAFTRSVAMNPGMLIDTAGVQLSRHDASCVGDGLRPVQVYPDNPHMLAKYRQRWATDARLQWITACVSVARSMGDSE